MYTEFEKFITLVKPPKILFNINFEFPKCVEFCIMNKNSTSKTRFSHYLIFLPLSHFLQNSQTKPQSIKRKNLLQIF